MIEIHLSRFLIRSTRRYKPFHRIDMHCKLFVLYIRCLQVFWSFFHMKFAFTEKNVFHRSIVSKQHYWFASDPVIDPFSHFFIISKPCVSQTMLQRSAYVRLRRRYVCWVHMGAAELRVVQGDDCASITRYCFSFLLQPANKFVLLMSADTCVNDFIWV